MRREKFPIISPKKRNSITDTFCNEIKSIWGEEKKEIGEKLFLIFWLKSLTGKKNHIKYKIYVKTISGKSNCQKQKLHS